MSAQSFILNRGTLRFSHTHMTKSQIIHEISQNIRLDGFKVASIAIFEHPMSVVMHLTSASNRRTIMEKLWPPARASLGSNETLKLKLKLSDLETQPNLHQISFKIETSVNLKPKKLFIISRYADILSRNIAENIKGIEEKKRQPNYPRLVYSV